MILYKCIRKPQQAYSLLRGEKLHNMCQNARSKKKNSCTYMMHDEHEYLDTAIEFAFHRQEIKFRRK